MHTVDEVDSTHNVFGLVLRSNLPIPGLPALETPTEILDVQIHLGVSPPTESGRPAESQPVVYTSSCADEGGKPIWEIRTSPHSSFFHLNYYDGMQFWLDRKGKVLWATWPATSSLEETSTYLLGPILGLLLRLRGVTCLHASAVAIENRCVAFVGSEGAGKSTVAATFAREGYGVLSDDIVALVEQEMTFHVVPAYPHINLWPDSVKMLYGSSEALPRFSPEWDKRRLALGEEKAPFENRPLPLGAIYLLEDRQPDSAPSVEAVRPQAAFLSLVADSYASKILDRDLRAREFAVLGRVVTAVPVRRMRASNDPSRLGALCQVICEDFAMLGFPARSPDS